MTCKYASSFSSSTPPWPLQTLRKKGFNGCNSPEPDGDDSIDQSPLNDRKTEDLDSLFKRYGVSTITLWSPYLTFSFCSSSLSLSSSFSVSLCLCAFFFFFFFLCGERRLWTRKSTGTLRAQTPRSPSPSPPALKRNTKKLTRSLIKWCRTIGCQWVPPTTLCNPAPHHPPLLPHIGTLLLPLSGYSFRMLMAVWLLTEHLPSPSPHPIPLPHLTSPFADSTYRHPCNHHPQTNDAPLLVCAWERNARHSSQVHWFKLIIIFPQRIFL